MKKLYLILGLLWFSAALAQAQNPVTYNPNELKEGQKEPAAQLINGYPATDYYYNQISIPADVLASTAVTDKIAVAFHNKMVAWEQSNKRPLRSLPKDELQSLLAQLKALATTEVNAAGKASLPNK